LARLTVEDCLVRENNRFALVVLAADRAKQLARGARPRVISHNRPAVVALREIAAGHVRFNESVRDIVDAFIAEKKLHPGTDRHSRSESKRRAEAGGKLV
jgi:DNA-directed RNA polymerase subunit omega